MPAPVAEAAVQLQRLAVAGGGGRAVPGRAVHGAQLVEGLGFPAPVAEAAVQLQRLAQRSGGRRVVVGDRAQGADRGEGGCLAGPVAQVAVQLQGPGRGWRRRPGGPRSLLV